jgi:hypothetical protein
MIPSYSFIYNLGKRRIYTSTDGYFPCEIVLKLKGKFYVYDIIGQPFSTFEQFIEHLKSLIKENNYNYDIIQLCNLLSRKHTIKLVRRVIKLGLLKKKDNLVVRVLDTTMYTRHNLYTGWGQKQGYQLKQDSKYKSYKRAMQRRWWQNDGKNPAKDKKEYVDYFEGVSSNVFGHPRKKFNLKSKKLQKGYRRSVLKRNKEQDL